MSFDELPSLLGLVQTTCWPGAVVRPKSAFDGGGSWNIDHATTQPVWPALTHGLTCLNSLFVTLPPSSSADTIRRRSDAFLSMTSPISCLRTNEPCEWPISTNPRPWLSCLM